MEGFSELSYLVHYPAFHVHYSAFTALAQMAAATVVVAGLCSAALRERLTYPVLGLFWTLTGLNYYLRTVGGVFGAVMFAICLAESLMLLVNLEKLRLSFRLSLCIDYLPQVLDMKTLNTAIGCAGSFTMLVLPTLVGQPDQACFPTPHLLAAFSFLFLSTVSPQLGGIPDDAVSVRLLHSIAVTKLPFLVYAVELLLAVSYSENYGTDQAVVSVLMVIGYFCRLRPNFEAPRRIPALMGARRRRDVLIEARPSGDGGQQGLKVIEEYEDEEGDRGNEFYREEQKTLKPVPLANLKPLHRD